MKNVLIIFLLFRTIWKKIVLGENLILIIEIIFRFIPLLIEEATSILKTQSIRGGLKNATGKLAKIKAIIPLIVPLIVQTIKRSESLADAITVRHF